MMGRFRGLRISSLVRTVLRSKAAALPFGVFAFFFIIGAIGRPAANGASPVSVWAATVNEIVVANVLTMGASFLKLTSFPNEAGTFRSTTPSGSIDLTNPFFASMGTNGRTCGSCHLPTEGWSISTDGLQARFDATNGLDPVFRTVDGSNSPLADVSTVDARRRAYSMLLTKGLIRVGLPIPAGAEFTLVAVDDPYGFASAKELSLFRRPLPTANLRFASDVMWDARESVTGQTLAEELVTQAKDATLGHAQAATAPGDAILRQIVNFQLAIHNAQDTDAVAGSLSANGALGGPDNLATQIFSLGINNPFPATGPNTFTNRAFALFGAWDVRPGADAASQKRASIARGENLFNNRQFTISGVAGLNDVQGRPNIAGTCTTCHNSPNVGNHSVSMPVNIGLTDANRRTPDMPLYTLRCTATGAITRTTDPGRALTTGKCADIGKFKVPVLRGLESRSPYFHNGIFDDLNDVVNFYKQRFGVRFNPDEQEDLIAFLESL